MNLTKLFWPVLKAILFTSSVNALGVALRKIYLLDYLPQESDFFDFFINKKCLDVPDVENFGHKMF